ncbi:MAG: hypothetical protein MG2_0322 [uncultured Candidatus Poseidoniales archaeon]|nr:MAG: hypothetical protein MG2_0322 [uncultured Candidatus Poseidoniales archaeon]
MFFFSAKSEQRPPCSSATKKPITLQIHEKSNVLSDDLKVRQDKEPM